MRYQVLAFLLSFSIIGWGTPRVFFNYKVYYTVEDQPYVETAIQFSGGTMKYKANEHGHLQADLEITQIFKKNDQIITVDKYLISSPEMKDSVVEDFFDVHRFLVPVDNYDFELIIKDLNANEKVEGDFKIDVPAINPNQMSCSEVDFIQNLSKSDTKDNFTKNGYRLIPYFTNYFPPEYDKIVYYLELYNTNLLFEDDESFAAIFNVRDAETKNIFDNYFQYKKLKPAKISPIINILPITELRSGKYELVMHIVNANNKILFEKVIEFKRRNDLPEPPVEINLNDIANSFAAEVSDDSITYYLGSLMPIAEQYEYEQIRALLVKHDTVGMRKFFYEFWKKTAPHNTYDHWIKYKAQVNYAEELFGTQIRAGYDSDRGRIHLKYGAPNFVTDQPVGTSAYPYQIWHYYKIGNQSNIRFVFYNPEMATNFYPLLHSDLRGEIKNANWQQEILKRNNSNIDLQQRNHGNSGIYFED